MDQFFIFFSLLNSERICGGRWKTTIQLYSIVNSVKSDEKMLNSGKGSQGMLFLQIQIFYKDKYVMCLKCPSLAKMPYFKS